MNDAAAVSDLLRPLAPRVLGVLLRRHGAFDTCEDAVQEALMAAAADWPVHGVPDNPTGWLITVATRRWTDSRRQDSARRRREQTAAAQAPREPGHVPGVDDTLTLCCCAATRR